MRITFFGPPGSGKGTQADRISDHFGLERISTGNLLRDEIESGSKLGLKIQEIVESGHLVSDEIVNEEVFTRIHRIEGFLLDGYPRNLQQAKALDRFLIGENKPLSGAVFLQVPDAVVKERLLGRLVCDCPEGKIPADAREGQVCSICGGRFSRRSDDSASVIDNRLHHYHAFTKHLEDYYSRRLTIIDGVGSIEEVFSRIRSALEEWA